jgi:hypothetical protein
MMAARFIGLIVFALLGLCAGVTSSGLAQQPDKPSRQVAATRYSVEDLVLGDKVDSDTVTSRTYHCGPSEQFENFTWCTSRSSKGGVRASFSMLHSSDDNIVYANKTQEPAFSSSTAAKEELHRITQKIGEQPKIIDMPHQSALGDGFIAIWGNVALTPVDAANISKLADGQSPKLGFMVDFITDFQRSAKTGLPIYRIGGGPGLVLAVSYGKPDRGTFRLIAVDASKFSLPPAQQRPQNPVVAQQQPATDQSPIAAQSLPARDKMSIAVQPSTNSDQSATVAQPSSQPINKGDEPPINITELKHTISSLRSELATSTARVTRLENQLSESERQLKQEAQARLNAESAKSRIEQTMLESRSGMQLWTILADVLVGSLIALLVILAPTLWNRFKNANVASKLPNVDQWLGHFERWLSSALARFPIPRGFPKNHSGNTSVKQVADMNVTTQPIN